MKTSNYSNPSPRHPRWLRSVALAATSLLATQLHGDDPVPAVPGELPAVQIESAPAADPAPDERAVSKSVKRRREASEKRDELKRDQELLSQLGVSEKEKQEPAVKGVQRMQLELNNSWADGRMGPDIAAHRFVFADRGRSRTMVIPGPATTSEQRSELREDLLVMHRIVSRALRPETGREPIRIEFGRSDGTDLDALYLDGYGVVFFLGVDYPLVAPDAQPDVAKDDDKDQDRTWERAKQELSGKPRVIAEEFNGKFWAGAEPAKPYEAARVQDLKRRLTQSMKYGANIRSLKPEDHVTLVVAGRSGQARGKVKASKGRVELDGGDTLIERPTPSSTTLTLTVRKSHVDLFAKGSLTLEAFEQAVRSQAFSTLDTSPQPARAVGF